MKESMVESRQLERSGSRIQYQQEEKIPVIVADNFPHLGTLTSLRFIEWVQQHPEGLVSLPTGKTPEYFIHETQRFLETWNRKETQSELAGWGIETGKKPDMKGLSFVQIDEFYPINPLQTNSFFFYVNKYYIEGFGMDPKKALLINCEKIGIPSGRQLEHIWDTGKVDLGLRYRNPVNEKEKLQKQVLHDVDQWCSEYEEAIRNQGGLGFFLGGIGPDGHIGFNVRGSDLHSTTRLAQINYETQAAASGDLGGIEVAKERLVITIGLSTITCNEECTAIIMAAGEAKAKIVAEAITRKKHILYPASVLQDLPAARFYITRGASKYLNQRQVELFREKELTPSDVERAVVDVALKKNKSIEELTGEDYKSSDFGKLLLSKGSAPVKELNTLVTAGLKEKMKRGVEMMKGKRFLHTEPHHDDIMLGYLPFVVRHIREHSTRHHFATLTSGFTAVTNAYMLNICTRMLEALKDNRYKFQERMDTGYFDPENSHEKDRDVWTYLDGVTRKSEELKDEGTLRRFLRDLIEVYDERDIDNIRDRVDELANYFTTQYPGKKDLDYIQKLKGMCREWESACLWGYFGWDSSSVENLRLGFYKGDIFTEEPTVSRDVKPILDLIRRVKPDVITVALDPEASGPDTHYKVLQAISEALRVYCEETTCEVDVIGYRNVWYRFHPSEANIFVPVSLNMLTLQESSFLNTYISQKDASFPSYEHDGPFTELSQKIQVEQYDTLKTCLGNDFFYEDTSALIRATRGLVFLKQMKLEEFIGLSRELKRQTENR